MLMDLRPMIVPTENKPSCPARRVFIGIYRNLLLPSRVYNIGLIN